MGRKVNATRDVTRIGLLSLIKEAISDQHGHDIAALSLVENVSVRLQKSLSQSNDSNKGVISND